jgi:hypothetical protein
MIGLASIIIIALCLSEVLIEGNFGLERSTGLQRVLSIILSIIL